MIDDRQGIKNINKSEAIDPATRASHFQNLNQAKLKFAQRSTKLDNLLTDLAKEKCFSKLDSPISVVEILNAISKLKIGKSTGLDNVSYHMIKCGKKFSYHVFRKYSIAVLLLDIIQYHGLQGTLYTYS